MKSKLLVQGDVCLRPIAKLPDGEKKIVTNKIVALGEATNHNHILTGAVDLYEIDGKMYALANGDGARLEHLTEQKQKADHNPLFLEREQVYEVILQNQFNPYTKLMERVID